MGLTYFTINVFNDTKYVITVAQEHYNFKKIFSFTLSSTSQHNKKKPTWRKKERIPEIISKKPKLKIPVIIKWRKFMFPHKKQCKYLSRLISHHVIFFLFDPNNLELLSRVCRPTRSAREINHHNPIFFILCRFSLTEHISL